MFGINYRYQLNSEKGTIKLAPTKTFMIINFVLPIVGFAGLSAWAHFENKKLVAAVTPDSTILNYDNV